MSKIPQPAPVAPAVQNVDPLPPSDPAWKGAFVIAAKAGMEIADKLSEFGAIDAATMRKLADLYAVLEEECILESDELGFLGEVHIIANRIAPAAVEMIETGFFDRANAIVNKIVPDVVEMARSGGSEAGQSARETGFVIGFALAIAETVLIGPGVVRRAPCAGKRLH